MKADEKFAQVRVIVASTEGQFTSRYQIFQTEVSTDGGETWKILNTSDTEIKQRPKDVPLVSLNIPIWGTHPGAEVIMGKRGDDGLLKPV